MNTDVPNSKHYVATQIIFCNHTGIFIWYNMCFVECFGKHYYLLSSFAFSTFRYKSSKNNINKKLPIVHQWGSFLVQMIL